MLSPRRSPSSKRPSKRRAQAGATTSGRAFMLLLHSLDLPQNYRSVVAPRFNCLKGSGVASLSYVRAAESLSLPGRAVYGGVVDG